jgi:hypothetical protein
MCVLSVCRQLAVWGVFWLLVLFYAPIVAAVQAPVNMDNLRKVSGSLCPPHALKASVASEAYCIPHVFCHVRGFWGAPAAFAGDL